MLANCADDPEHGCQEGEALFCCHFVTSQPILVSSLPTFKASILCIFLREIRRGVGRGSRGRGIYLPIYLATFSRGGSARKRLV